MKARYKLLALGAPLSTGTLIYLLGLSAWLLVIGVWIALVPILLGIVDSELSTPQPGESSVNNDPDLPEADQPAAPWHQIRHD